MFTIPQDLRDHIDEELQDTPQVRPTTRGLMVNLMLGLPVTINQADDFGIMSASHYQALRSAIDTFIEENGLISCAVELDQALGNGAQVTQLVKTYAPEYKVTFSTVWDLLYGRR